MEELKDMSILNLKKGDVVILKTKTMLKNCDFKRLTEYLESKVESCGIKCIIVDNSMDVMVLRQECKEDDADLQKLIT
jgi:hypothetical protein